LYNKRYSTNHEKLSGLTDSISNNKLIILHHIYIERETLLSSIGKKAYDELIDAAVIDAGDDEARVKNLLDISKLATIGYWVNVFATLLGPRFFFIKKGNKVAN